ncbi:MAG: hypothetical protein M3Y86_04870 [Verrucomicrobiota bacterium]|nr:hypothetical protein [Verrucomicrobiota bacterium]
MWLPPDLTKTKELTEIVHNAVTVLAVIVGGLAAYWKWFRGRTFSPRLEVSVEATFTGDEKGGYATVVCTAKNLGLVGVPLDRDGSTLRICAPVDLSPDGVIARMHWDEHPVDAADVFLSHDWIEAGEPIVDRHIYFIGENPAPIYKCELIVARKPNRRSRRTAWSQHTYLDTRPSPAEAAATKGR